MRELNIKSRICLKCNKSYNPTSGKQKVCKDCKNIWDKEITSKYNKSHRKEFRERVREWRKQNPNKDNERYARLRLEGIAHYGNCCACCGESIKEFLVFDHIKNDGYKMRKIHGTASTFYYWLRKNNYPSSFQVLCASCNQGKKMNHGICPHQEKQSNIS